MCRILVVEDEYFVAYELEQMLSDMGYEPIGIAADARSALELGKQAEIALVDLNLNDGPTGSHIGQVLAEEHGVTIVFMTANPDQIGKGVPGTLGVLPKPAAEEELRQAVDYAVSHRMSEEAEPPPSLRLFPPSFDYSPAFS